MIASGLTMQDIEIKMQRYLRCRDLFVVCVSAGEAEESRRIISAPFQLPVLRLPDIHCQPVDIDGHALTGNPALLQDLKYFPDAFLILCQHNLYGGGNPLPD